jgi:hypothetical protein
VLHGLAEELERRFMRAAGIRESDDAALSDPSVRAAHVVVVARRAVLSGEPCPKAVRDRVTAIFAFRPRGLLGSVLDLAFDSGATLAPAMRGAPRASRTLRYRGAGVTFDVQVRRGADGAPVLYVAVEPPSPGLEIVVRVLPQETSRRAKLDSTGTGEVRLPARSRRVSASIRSAGGTSFRVGSISLD